LRVVVAVLAVEAVRVDFLLVQLMLLLLEILPLLLLAQVELQIHK